MFTQKQPPPCPVESAVAVVAATILLGLSAGPGPWGRSRGAQFSTLAVDPHMLVQQRVL